MITNSRLSLLADSRYTQQQQQSNNNKNNSTLTKKLNFN